MAEESGACCQPDGTCFDNLDIGQCAAFGGTPWPCTPGEGDGYCTEEYWNSYTCNSVIIGTDGTCPACEFDVDGALGCFDASMQHGACCTGPFGDKTCGYKTEAHCNDDGGSYLGATACGVADCNPTFDVSCCLAGECVWISDIDEWDPWDDCGLLGGIIHLGSSDCGGEGCDNDKCCRVTDYPWEDSTCDDWDDRGDGVYTCNCFDEDGNEIPECFAVGINDLDCELCRFPPGACCQQHPDYERCEVETMQACHGRGGTFHYRKTCYPGVCEGSDDMCMSCGDYDCADFFWVPHGLNPRFINCCPCKELMDCCGGGTDDCYDWGLLHCCPSGYREGYDRFDCGRLDYYRDYPRDSDGIPCWEIFSNPEDCLTCLPGPTCLPIHNRQYLKGCSNCSATCHACRNKPSGGTWMYCYQDAIPNNCCERRTGFCHATNHEYHYWACASGKPEEDCSPCECPDSMEPGPCPECEGNDCCEGCPCNCGNCGPRCQECDRPEGVLEEPDRQQVQQILQDEARKILIDEYTNVQLPDGECVWMDCKFPNCPYPKCMF